MFAKRAASPGKPKPADGKSTTGNKSPPRAKQAAAKSPAKKPDVIADCTKSYENFSKKLGALVDALKKRQASMVQHRKADQEVIRQVTAFMEGTPLVAKSGAPSYANVNEPLNKTMVSYEETFETQVIDYAREWHKLVDVKFTAALKEAKKAKKDLDHYQSKMTSLKQTQEKAKAKGQDIEPKSVEKLDRNEEKLESAIRIYQKHDKGVVHLVQELIDRSWKDLYPLMVELLQFDMTSAVRRATSLANLNNVLQDLQAVAKKEGLHMEGKNSTELWRSRQAAIRAPTESYRPTANGDSSDEGRLPSKSTDESD